MDILLIEKDHLVRDMVKVGLQLFPEFTVIWGEGYAGINELRQRSFDCVFLGVDSVQGDGMKLLRHMRSFDRATELVLMAPTRVAKELASERTKHNVTGLLTTPIEVTEFFKLIGRMRARRAEAEAARSL
jgi:DNA-binding NtrC family response regulator